MRLRVMLPSRVLIDERNIDKVIAEGLHGVFALLPLHVDFVSPVVPGILLYARGDDEWVVGVDHGVLVKRGDQVRISVRDAVRGDDAETIRDLVTRRFHQLDEREIRTRRALARLEASFYRGFVEQEALRGG